MIAALPCPYAAALPCPGHKTEIPLFEGPARCDVVLFEDTDNAFVLHIVMKICRLG